MAIGNRSNSNIIYNLLQVILSSLQNDHPLQGGHFIIDKDN